MTASRIRLVAGLWLVAAVFPVGSVDAAVAVDPLSRARSVLFGVEPSSFGASLAAVDLDGDGAPELVFGPRAARSWCAARCRRPRSLCSARPWPAHPRAPARCPAAGFSPAPASMSALRVVT